ncbi:unnamed protein product [Spirodela intermedia]|uniref:Uncharacterized protein n=1 Tax=Spirodela intermedia TaxID=51605 RepID=A0A7I8IJ65_SPIIN|nr:unnamed protein product [Spirodela intermedia]CAA6657004.1 unnamed protein product [Spirodela intermedia]
MGTCTRVATLHVKGEEEQNLPPAAKGTDEGSDQELPVRRGFSLTRMSEGSIWVTGQSGSIYERFWNGVQWVAAPHELPLAAGRAVSVFIVSQTVLVLSELGKLYKLQVSDNTQPSWIESPPTFEENEELSTAECLRSGVASHDGERLYLSTANGHCWKAMGLNQRGKEGMWSDHGKPPGGDVVSITDAGVVRPGMVFTVSSAGELYEFNKNTKPSWKKHIWSQTSRNVQLTPITGCILDGLLGLHSSSLFLLSKDGFLVERRFHQRKWKWLTHGAPEGQILTAITQLVQTEIEDKISSLFFTTATGLIFEYLPPKHSVDMQGKQTQGQWINHMHPQHAKVARGIPGIHLEFGRLVFPLDDGRLGELHMSSSGGDGLGPNYQTNTRRKTPQKYEWSIVEVPETEGWNAEYCTEERGPTNCITGTKNVLKDNEFSDTGPTTMKRRKTKECTLYIPLGAQEKSAVESSEPKNYQTKSTSTNFWLRSMHADQSFLLTTEGGLIFEYLYTENIWIWLRHEHLTPIKGALASYNGSLFLVDTHGNLLMLERNETELSLINCTAMKRGRKVTAGPPWDGAHEKLWRVMDEDALFFVSKKGRLLQFTVAFRKFNWKDCHHPPSTKIDFIVDQEVLRMNIIFVIGRDGRLYQYNRVTELWHQHCQSPHLVLHKSPATAIRQSSRSLIGSLFMLLENGGLVEYHWDSQDGWSWVEHGLPNRNLTLVGAPGPSLWDSQLFLVGSDGQVFRRYMDQMTWKWASHGFPYQANASIEFQVTTTGDEKYFAHNGMDMQKEDRKDIQSIDSSCDDKVSAVRPIRFSQDSLIFQLRDGRLAELRKSHGDTEDWEWTRIIGTPTSQCVSGYLTIMDS